MIKLPWIVGGTAVLLLSAVLYARQGVVVMAGQGQRYQGEITDKGATYEILIPDPTKGPKGTKQVLVNKAGVKDIIWADEVARQVKAAAAKLDRRDVSGRLALAKQAMDAGAIDTENEVLTEAHAIDPANRDVNAMLEQIRMSRGDKAPVAAATQPAEMATPKTTRALPPKREVTLEEVNHIRQLEWDRKEAVSVRIDNDARTRYIAGSGLPAREISRLTPIQLAADILDKGKPDLADGVHILSDPASVAEYRKMQRLILSGCATAGCHSGPSAKGGSFLLFAADNAQAYFTNFLELQTFTQKIGDVQRQMIDRTVPERSLLLEYMLPPGPQAVAVTPHPTVQGYKGVAKSKTDAKYQQINDWIQKLAPVAPNYDIDLSKDAMKKEPRATGAGR